MSKLIQNTLEQTTLSWFESLRWGTVFGPDIGPEREACDLRVRYGEEFA